jgi:L-phenylalanine/L-methionine N-acetyltransferase
MMALSRPAITIRRAAVSDAEAIQATFASPKAMAGTLQLPFPSVDKWRKWLVEIPADDFVLVAEIAGEVVGNLGLHPAAKSPRRRHAGGIGMSVRDDWQGRGVGSALLAAALDLADNWLNYTRLELTVYTDNAAAQALYRKYGFDIEGTLRAYAFRNGRFIDAYTMARLSPVARAGADATAKTPRAGSKAAAKDKVAAGRRKRSS